MITIFSIPKPFLGHIGVIQRNALGSWAMLRPKCEIILLGDDAGVAEAASEFGALHIPRINKNEFGTPLLDSAFSLARKAAAHEIIAYVNADIILLPDFASAVENISLESFLIAGRRWDMEISEALDFDNVRQGRELLIRLKEKGRMHGFTGVDYFIFPKKLLFDMPAFAVGRPGWDNWLIWKIKMDSVPFIDATEAITVIHQNHDYSHSLYSKKNRVGGPELKRNIVLAGGFTNMFTLKEADWVLGKTGLKRTGVLRGLLVRLGMFYPWRLMLSAKRRLQNYIY
jgi:hypothetical protein